MGENDEEQEEGGGRAQTRSVKEREGGGEERNEEEGSSLRQLPVLGFSEFPWFLGFVRILRLFCTALHYIALHCITLL